MPGPCTAGSKGLLCIKGEYSTSHKILVCANTNTHTDRHTQHEQVALTGFVHSATTINQKSNTLCAVIMIVQCSVLQEVLVG